MHEGQTVHRIVQVMDKKGKEEQTKIQTDKQKKILKIRQANLHTEKRTDKKINKKVCIMPHNYYHNL